MNCVRIVLASIACLLSGSSLVVAQTLPVQVDVDFSTFAYDGSNSLVEMYLAVDATSMEFGASEGGFRADLPIDLTILRSSELASNDLAADVVWEDSVALTFVIADTTGLTPGQHFVHQVRAAVPPGEYELELLVPADTLVDRQELRIRLDVVVPSFAGTEIAAISDITLATQIEPSSEQGSPFYKNGLIVRPNANQVFGQGLTRLYYYAETYNVNKVRRIGPNYTVVAYLAEANISNPMPGFSRRMERTTRSPDVIVGSFDLGSLPSGSYFLRLVVVNADNESVVEQARRFFVYNPGVQRAEPEAVQGVFESSVFASLSEEDVRRELERIQPIANDRERTRAKRIQDLDEQRRFLMSFWQARDPNPNSPGNAFRDEYLQRVRYADERYTSSFSEGWKSARGRVLLRHGLPSAIDPHLYERDSVPYEVWEYNNIPGEGQAVFVFADRSGFGQFDLIHSTVTGETTLPNWQDELKRR